MSPHALLIVIGTLFATASLVFGCIAIFQIRNAGETRRGMGLAVAAVIAGGVALLGLLAGPRLIRPGSPAAGALTGESATQGARVTIRFTHHDRGAFQLGSPVTVFAQPGTNWMPPTGQALQLPSGATALAKVAATRLPNELTTAAVAVSTDSLTWTTHTCSFRTPVGRHELHLPLGLRADVVWHSITAPPESPNVKMLERHATSTSSALPPNAKFWLLTLVLVLLPVLVCLTAIVLFARMTNGRTRVVGIGCAGLLLVGLLGLLLLAVPLSFFWMRKPVLRNQAVVARETEARHQRDIRLSEMQGPATGETPSQLDAMGFKPAILERQLARRTMIDFDTDTQGLASEELYRGVRAGMSANAGLPEPFAFWMTDRGMDAWSDEGRLTTFGMRATRVAESAWTLADAAKLRETLSAIGTPSHPMAHVLAPDLVGTATYAFETREGAAGMMQVLRPGSDTTAVKVRYKLMRPRRASAPASKPIPAEAVRLRAEIQGLRESAQFQGRDMTDKDVLTEFSRELASRERRMEMLIQGTVAEPVWRRCKELSAQMPGADPARQAGILNALRPLGAQLDALFTAAGSGGPDAPAAASTEPRRGTNVVMQVSASGEVSIDGAAIPLAELPARLSTRHSAPVVLTSDPRTPVKHVQAILDLLKSAGITNVALSTQPR
jgi:hypothetical protein